MGDRILLKKVIIRTAIGGILALNVIGYTGAYLLTHYKTDNKFSLGVPRSNNYNSPLDFDLQYTKQKIFIEQNEWLDSWFIASPVAKSEGVVILFHGKDSNKSSLLDAAKILHSLKYDTLLIDFRGSGASSGNTTTIGANESQDVVAAFNYLKKSNGQKPVILYGISMGSAAILRAIAKYQIQPDGIILELPFISLLDSAKTRLKSYSLPPSPMAELMVFWGGVQHGFNGFNHRPIEDAKAVKCPVLILAGKRDRTIALAKVERLAQNFNVTHDLVVFSEAGHELLVRSDRKLWQQSVKSLLDTINKSKYSEINLLPN